MDFFPHSAVGFPILIGRSDCISSCKVYVNMLVLVAIVSTYTETGVKDASHKQC